MKNIKWIFFDIGSTLVDESVAFRKRVEKAIANTNVSYDDFYSKMVEISKYNQNGYHKALEYYGLTMAPWNSDDEFVYPEAEESENTDEESVSNPFEYEENTSAESVFDSDRGVLYPHYSIKTNRSSVAVSSLYLLRYLCNIIQNQLRFEEKQKVQRTDKKFQQKINDKKQAQGLKM